MLLLFILNGGTIEQSLILKKWQPFFNGNQTIYLENIPCNNKKAEGCIYFDTDRIEIKKDSPYFEHVLVHELLHWKTRSVNEEYIDWLTGNLIDWRNNLL